VAHLERIDPDRLGDVLKLRCAEIGNLEIEPPLHLPVGLLREADRARLRDPFEPGGDVDRVAHQIAVFLFDDIAEMDADARLDSLFWGQASVALG
jgi:hypothetical protein